MSPWLVVLLNSCLVGFVVSSSDRVSASGANPEALFVFIVLVGIFAFYLEQYFEQFCFLVAAFYLLLTCFIPLAPERSTIQGLSGTILPALVGFTILIAIFLKEWVKRRIAEKQQDLQQEIETDRDNLLELAVKLGMKLESAFSYSADQEYSIRKDKLEIKKKEAENKELAGKQKKQLESIQQQQQQLESKIRLIEARAARLKKLEEAQTYLKELAPAQAGKAAQQEPQKQKAQQNLQPLRQGNKSLRELKKRKRDAEALRSPILNQLYRLHSIQNFCNRWTLLSFLTKPIADNTAHKIEQKQQQFTAEIEAEVGKKADLQKEQQKIQAAIDQRIEDEEKLLQELRVLTEEQSRLESQRLAKEQEEALLLGQKRFEKLKQEKEKIETLDALSIEELHLCKRNLRWIKSAALNSIYSLYLRKKQLNLPYLVSGLSIALALLLSLSQRSLWEVGSSETGFNIILWLYLQTAIWFALILAFSLPCALDRSSRSSDVVWFTALIEEVLHDLRVLEVFIPATNQPRPTARNFVQLIVQGSILSTAIFGLMMGFALTGVTR